MPTVNDRVKSVVVKTLMVEESIVNEDSNFMEDLEADSLAMVELVMAFEVEFFPGDDNFSIPDEDASNIVTVRDAIAYLEGLGIKDTE